MRNRLIPWLVVVVLLSLPGCNKASAPSASSTDSSQSQSAQTPSPSLPVVVNAGTVLVVTLDQTVSSKTNNSGERFDASLAEPVIVDGRQVLPVGAKTYGTIIRAESAGHLKGGAVLALTLDSITLKGQIYPIQSTNIVEAGKGRGKRTGVGAGGGAAFGAIVGALAGGGKGAAVGAVAGAGAGTAGVAFTGKRDITLPAETRLYFKLTQPVSISLR